jgi:spore coat protein A
VARPASDDSHIPDRLAHLETLSPEQATITRTFAFRTSEHGWLINGSPFDPNRADAQPELGAVEIWRFVTDFDHPIHLHLAHFQVLGRGTGPPGRYDQGWKDTIDLHPTETAAVIARFSDYPGRFVFHCHNLEHEDMAMMGNLVTIN